MKWKIIKFCLIKFAAYIIYQPSYLLDKTPQLLGTISIDIITLKSIAVTLTSWQVSFKFLNNFCQMHFAFIICFLIIAAAFITFFISASLLKHSVSLKLLWDKAECLYPPGMFWFNNVVLAPYSGTVSVWLRMLVCWTSKSDSGSTMATIIINLLTLKAAPKDELLFNKLAIG
jgi:hypothetical protein